MDDSKWHIGGKVLFLNGKVYNKQIKNVIAGRMLQEIKVIQLYIYFPQKYGILGHKKVLNLLHE